MNYMEYKKKHDWYDSNVVTLEKQLADGQARLGAANHDLKIARDECNVASDACLKKPATDVTPDEWARFEAADKRVGELDAKRLGIEGENGRTSAGLDTAKGLRSDLENDHPEFKERNIAELEAAMQKPTSDDPGLGKAGTGMQAYAGVVAVAATMNVSAPAIPSNVEGVRAVDPAAITRAEAGSLDFENMPTSVRDQMRADSKPLRDSEVEQHPPPPPNETLTYSVGASNDPPISYSVAVLPPDDTFGASSASSPSAPTPSAPPPEAKLAGPDESQPLLLTSDRQDQKLLTYEEPKLLTDQRSTTSAVSAPEAPQPSSPASTTPPPGDSIPAKTPESTVLPPSDGMNM